MATMQNAFFLCVAEVPILHVQQLVGVLLLVLFSGWRSVLRKKRRCALLSRYIFMFAFLFPLLSVPYFQFFQKLEDKIQANELEQTNMQEKSRMRVAFTFLCHPFVMSVGSNSEI
jgi:hypothetical protein